MRSTSILTVLATAGMARAVPMTQFTRRSGLSFDYDDTKVRGVNLGGWLVLEPWITPSLFEAAGDAVVDEWTFCETLGADEAGSRLEEHWSSWITESDISAIAAAGLNHIRVPIGYWAINPQDGDPYVKAGQLGHLDNVVSWAASSGLKVLIDLHGAPQSQNGFDNSGHRGSVGWGDETTRSEAIDSISVLAERYTSNPAVTAIEVLNEPLIPSVDINDYKQYVYDGWGTIRDSNEDTVVAFHDGFQTDSSWNGFMNTAAGTNNVLVDTHQYQIFTLDAIAQTPDEHFAAACEVGANDLTGLDKWTIVGEWTGALTDCAKYLNGRGIGARYDGSFAGSTYVGSCDGKYTGTVAALSDADKYNIRRFNEAQLDAYETATGWIFWTWKTESSPEWDLQAQLAAGLFPQPLTSREYPGQCSGYIGK